MGWHYLSIPKLQRCNRWSLGMDTLFHPTHYNGCNYLSVLRLKLIHVIKGANGVVLDILSNPELFRRLPCLPLKFSMSAYILYCTYTWASLHLVIIKRERLDRPVTHGHLAFYKLNINSVVMCDKWISNSIYRVCTTKSSFNSNRLYNCTLFRIKGITLLSCHIKLLLLITMTLIVTDFDINFDVSQCPR